MNRLQFVIHSTGDGQVGCSQAGVIIDNAAIIKFLCISYCTCLSLAGSWGICMFNLSGWGFPGDSSFGVVGGGLFHLPHDLFYSTLLYNIHFSLPITICCKNGTFSLCLSRESHVEIWLRRFFSA